MKSSLIFLVLELCCKILISCHAKQSQFTRFFSQNVTECFIQNKNRDRDRDYQVSENIEEDEESVGQEETQLGDKWLAAAAPKPKSNKHTESAETKTRVKAQKPLNFSDKHKTAVKI